jgi:DNA-binding transcriptional ArsR family regulator
MPLRPFPRKTGLIRTGCWFKRAQAAYRRGEIAAALGLPPNTLSFHFDRLRQAGLVTVRRNGRSMIYAARYDTMNALIGFLTENCCGGQPERCAPAAACAPGIKTEKETTP